MAEYITKGEILALNKLLIEEGKHPGDYHQIREEGTLDLLLHQINNWERYQKDTIRAVAHYIYMVAARHIFASANKRTACFGAFTILAENNYTHKDSPSPKPRKILTIKLSDKSQRNMMDFITRVARYEASEREIEKWLSDNFKKVRA